MLFHAKAFKAQVMEMTLVKPISLISKQNADAESLRKRRQRLLVPNDADLLMQSLEPCFGWHLDLTIGVKGCQSTRRKRADVSLQHWAERRARALHLVLTFAPSDNQAEQARTDALVRLTLGDTAKLERADQIKVEAAMADIRAIREELKLRREKHSSGNRAAET
ncbi:hypothetical protein [Methylobacterium sp. Leaf111]|uniref:hypothetical protein n=1 Tax=Methylobacterium sp. Leaf111 TaxID=1736257 RepID=UPI001AEBA93F|nr:hypothetical protein [Methylobacterium sp. Leaf111]